MSDLVCSCGSKEFVPAALSKDADVFVCLKCGDRVAAAAKPAVDPASVVVPFVRSAAKLSDDAATWGCR